MRRNKRLDPADRRTVHIYRQVKPAVAQLARPGEPGAELGLIGKLGYGDRIGCHHRLPFRLDLGRSQAAQHQPLPSYHHVADHGASRITVRGGIRMPKQRINLMPLPAPDPSLDSDRFTRRGGSQSEDCVTEAGSHDRSADTTDSPRPAPEDLPSCHWSGSALHLKSITRALERVRRGEMDYLAVCPPSGLPVAIGGIDPRARALYERLGYVAYSSAPDSWDEQAPTELSSATRPCHANAQRAVVAHGRRQPPAPCDPAGRRGEPVRTPPCVGGCCRGQPPQV
jgi:hypothetical protein